MKHAKIKIETIPLGDLKPHPRNPRKHPKPGTDEWNSLKASLKDVYFDPLVWNKRNGQLVSGHLRRKVLEEMGCEKADCVVVNLTEKQHVKILLRANRNDGEWDNTELEHLLAEMDSDLERTLAGFAPLDLKEIGIGMLNSTTPEAAIHSQFLVMIECDSEEKQSEVLNKCLKQKWSCKALTS